MFRRLFELCIEGEISQRIWKKIGRPVVFVWKKVWKELDRIISICLRFVIKWFIPIEDNKVFFHTQENKYCCNPKYISEEFIKEGFDDIVMVWRGVKKEGDAFPDNDKIRFVKFNTWAYFKELYSSKAIITNSFLFVGLPVKLKKGQILLETWHGSLGIKKYGSKDIKDYWRRVLALKQTGEMTSYCISNSILENNSFRDTYWPNTPIVDYGHARNDLFFDNFKGKREELKNTIFSKYEIDKDAQILMYGPTFRDDHSLEYYDIDFQRLLDVVKEKFGGKWCVFLRYHPSMSKLPSIKKKMEEYKNLPVYNVTGYDDMQELIAVTDIAITDYSSWIYDFVLKRKPGFIFATDIKSYDQERGFYYPIETTPFAIAQNNDELMDSIMKFNNDEYLKKVEIFLDDKGCIDDGHSSERIVKFIRNLIKGIEPDDALRNGEREAKK